MNYQASNQDAPPAYSPAESIASSLRDNNNYAQILAFPRFLLAYPGNIGCTGQRRQANSNREIAIFGCQEDTDTESLGNDSQKSRSSSYRNLAAIMESSEEVGETELDAVHESSEQLSSMNRSQSLENISENANGSGGSMNSNDFEENDEGSEREDSQARSDDGGGVSRAESFVNQASRGRLEENLRRYASSRRYTSIRSRKPRHVKVQFNSPRWRRSTGGRDSWGFDATERRRQIEELPPLSPQLSPKTLPPSPEKSKILDTRSKLVRASPEGSLRGVRRPRRVTLAPLNSLTPAMMKRNRRHGRSGSRSSHSLRQQDSLTDITTTANNGAQTPRVSAFRENVPPGFKKGHLGGSLSHRHGLKDVRHVMGKLLSSSKMNWLQHRKLHNVGLKHSASAQSLSRMNVHPGRRMQTPSGRTSVEALPMTQSDNGDEIQQQPAGTEGARVSRRQKKKAALLRLVGKNLQQIA